MPSPSWHSTSSCILQDKRLSQWPKSPNPEDCDIRVIFFRKFVS